MSAINVRCESKNPECHVQCGLPAGHLGSHQNGTICRAWEEEIPAPLSGDSLHGLSSLVDRVLLKAGVR